MKPRSLSLYEILGVPPDAALAQLQGGFRTRMEALEAQRPSMAPERFEERRRLLRVALSTLSDPVSRLGYDARLAAAQPPAGTAARAAALPRPPVPQVAQVPQVPAAALPGALSLLPLERPVPPQVQAEALALRADALSLRADAMMLRAGMAPHEEPTMGARLLGASKSLVRAIGLVVVLLFVLGVVSRCMMRSDGSRQQQLDAQAREKVALQEYYQTHGVRPANMAELELLEAERMRNANQERAADRNREKAEFEQQRFEAEARRRGEEVSANLQAAEERARYEAERQEERERQEAEMQRRRQLVEQEMARRRQMQQEEQWRSVLRN